MYLCTNYLFSTIIDKIMGEAGILTMMAKHKKTLRERRVGSRGNQSEIFELSLSRSFLMVLRTLKKETSVSVML